MRINKEQAIKVLVILEHLVDNDEMESAAELFNQIRPSFKSCIKWATEKQKQILETFIKIGE